MKNSTKDLLLGIAIIVVVGGVFFGAIVGVGYVARRVHCHFKTYEIGYDARYQFIGGCQIKKDGRWIPLENFRDI